MVVRRRQVWEPRAARLEGELEPVVDVALADVSSGGVIAGLRIAGVVDASGLGAEPIEMDGCVLARARLMSIDVDRWRMRDLEFDGCDLVGVVGGGLKLEAVAFRGGRLAGCAWVGGDLQDVVFVGVVAHELALRFTRLRRVVFDSCALPKLDLSGAELDHVTFRGCDLSGARFKEARVAAARFVRCDLRDIEGAGGLAGAHVDAAALPALAPALAREVGLHVGESAEIESLET